MEVKLHDIGEGMTEADISCFLVKPGDRVKADDPLVEVITDKMTAEIPSPCAGIVKEFRVKPGSTVKVGTTLLILETVEGLKKTEATQVMIANSTTHRIIASPYTRKIARDNFIKIEMIEGSGPAGRITDEDVYRFIQKDSATNKPIISMPAIRKAEPVPLSEDKVVNVPKENKLPSSSNKVPFRGRRKQIAKAMQKSVYTIPHCTHFEEVDVTELIDIRKGWKSFDRDVSATAFFIKALSICLKDFPIFNARLFEEEEEIELLAEHNIGIAVDCEDGLVVPVLRNIEKKSLLSIHSEMKELTNRALENQLNVKDLSGGTFTISNVGPLGGSIGATPIIQHPQVALVSFHKTRKMPVVTDNDEIIIRSMMNLSMSFDHRVVDGATAVRFTNRFSQLISNPNSLLLELI
ncbi:MULTISPECIES: dihydrolipoamide acetyltransferase family protein [unclassified Bacillus (in: firmicutes)]|uniref:dihydrolipoamide acetyltransferase family protein n=1 Tax=unclassified Bacillus (in: firmicutes) TaxID=185979 RepID=UPI0008E55FD1|nr:MULTISPECIES: dihydrolipoamide acetyltransferase family protein [unclassified Bacillus (in: firmicutes)]SFA88554.1 pyruvate dehydrogenase E2 component (dihydrolipoamide acetyltransferase) [Bacillus sp. UNCCL13]SFQ84639.1 pyruvate dehydrogenase E2 component (dihydrolipoamide acetyltransferase) [Bacillus sp. cl95]